ncbi:MAG: hypothetical protein ABI140_06005 [Jatrophihabitantaceae bacterium]
MSVVQTVLVFGGIPLGVFGAVAALVLGPGAVRAPRYRPGGAWDYHPVWYLPHSQQPAVESAQVAGQPAALTGSVAEPVVATGGASGEW